MKIILKFKKALSLGCGLAVIYFALPHAFGSPVERKVTDDEAVTSSLSEVSKRVLRETSYSATETSAELKKKFHGITNSATGSNPIPNTLFQEFPENHLVPCPFGYISVPRWIVNEGCFKDQVLSDVIDDACNFGPLSSKIKPFLLALYYSASASLADKNALIARNILTASLDSVNNEEKNLYFQVAKQYFGAAIKVSGVGLSYEILQNYTQMQHAAFYDNLTIGIEYPEAPQHKVISLFLSVYDAVCKVLKSPVKLFHLFQDLEMHRLILRLGTATAFPDLFLPKHMHDVEMIKQQLYNNPGMRAVLNAIDSEIPYSEVNPPYRRIRGTLNILDYYLRIFVALTSKNIMDLCDLPVGERIRPHL